MHPLLFWVGDRDVHGGAAAAALAVAARQRYIFWKFIAVAAGFLKNHRGSGAVAAALLKIHRGSGRIFFEDIEKVHEFNRISVFTSETPWNWMNLAD